MEDYPTKREEEGGTRTAGRGRGGGEPIFPTESAFTSTSFPSGPSASGGGRGRGNGRGVPPPSPNPASSHGHADARGAGDGHGRGRGRGRGGREEMDFSKAPPGLFKSSDWNCPSCGNVNWERREFCNMCGGKKPTLAGSGEAREGLGGGFLERQERGAISQAVEVGEDGFDDFGRKKAKEKVDRKAKEMAALARLKATYG